MGAEAEILVAATSVLVPQPPDANALGAASAYTDSWPGRIRAWLGSRDVRRFRLPPNVEIAKVRSLVSRPLTETEKADLAVHLTPTNPILAVDFLAVLELARGFLADAYPLQEVDTVLGVGVELQPAPDEAARWLAQVAVIENPERILDELEMGSLEQAQAQAFKAVYPGLFMEMWMEVQAALGEMRAAGVTSLPFDREAGVRTLGQLGWSAPIVVQEYQPEAAEQERKPLELERHQAPAEKLLRPLG